MKTMLKVAAAMLLASGAAAYANETAANEGSGAQSAATAAKAAKAKKYCLTIEPSVGTRISKRECLTKAEWEAMGVELKGTR